MKNNTFTSYVITFRCPDRLGIVAKFSSLFFEAGAFITNTAQYSDTETGQFFQRCVFDGRQLKLPYSSLLSALNDLADEIDMDYRIRPTLLSGIFTVEGDQLFPLLSLIKCGRCQLSMAWIKTTHKYVRHYMMKSCRNFCHHFWRHPLAIYG